MNWRRSDLISIFTLIFMVAGWIWIAAVKADKWDQVNAGLGTIGILSKLTYASSTPFLNSVDRPVQIPLANLQSSAPPGGIIGVIMGCSNCTTTPLCISTGTTTGQWASLSNKTSACQ